MEYVGDESMGAPDLHSVTLEEDEARRLYGALIRNIEMFLSCQRVHADLSAYNVLYWQGDFRIIDFPQTVDAFDNPHALFLLGRDVERICQYFARYAIEASAADIAADLWTRFLRAEL